MAIGARKGVISVLAMCAVAVVLGATASQAAAQTAFDGITPEELWLRVDKMQGTVSDVPEKDNFMMSGSFNLPVGAVDPASDVTLSVGGWSANFPAASWKRSGKSTKYSAKGGNLSGSIYYWVGGSSKCTFIMSGKKQDLDESAGEPSNLVVRLVIGGTFDRDVAIALQTRGPAFKLDGIVSTPALLLDQVKVKLNTKKVNGDWAMMKGRIVMGEDDYWEPETGTMAFLIGPLYIEIAPGTFVWNESGTTSVTGDLPGGGTYRLLVNSEDGKFSLTAMGADLSTITNPAALGVALVDGDLEGTWLTSLTMKENGAGTLLMY